MTVVVFLNDFDKPIQKSRHFVISRFPQHNAADKFKTNGVSMLIKQIRNKTRDFPKFPEK